MRRRDLLTQVLVVNLLLIVAAVVAAVIAANPDGSLGDTPEAGLVLGFAIALTIVLNVFLLQRRIQPLEDLVDQMERADLSRPGANLKLTETPAGPEEVARLHHAFVRMLERLEAERRRRLQRRPRRPGGGAGADRARPARRGQPVADRAPAAARGGAREGAARARRRARRDPRRSPTRRCRSCSRSRASFGPPRSTTSASRRRSPATWPSVGRQSGIEASFEAEGDIASVPQDVQVVAYRVAQEALSNAVRHSGAAHLNVRLEREDGSVELSVADDGRGFTFDQASRGLGLAGMRERALLVDGELQVESRPAGRHKGSAPRADSEHR